MMNLISTIHVAMDESFEPCNMRRPDSCVSSISMLRVK